MTSRPSIRLTPLELELMDIFWKRGELAVREVQEALPEEKRTAYTTIQTVVTRLEQKGALRRTRKIGNAYLYEALVTKTSAYRRKIDELLAFFGGSTQPLMSHLVESGRLTLSDLRQAETALRKSGKINRDPDGDDDDWAT